MGRAKRYPRWTDKGQWGSLSTNLLTPDPKLHRYGSSQGSTAGGGTWGHCSPTHTRGTRRKGGRGEPTMHQASPPPTSPWAHAVHLGHSGEEGTGGPTTKPPPPPDLVAERPLPRRLALPPAHLSGAVHTWATGAGHHPAQPGKAADLLSGVPASRRGGLGGHFRQPQGVRYSVHRGGGPQPPKRTFVFRVYVHRAKRPGSCASRHPGYRPPGTHHSWAGPRLRLGPPGRGAAAPHQGAGAAARITA